MKSYVVKSVFHMTGKISHIELMARGGDDLRQIQLPWINARTINKGDAFYIHTSGDGKSEIAYEFHGRLYICPEISNKNVARGLLRNIPGLKSGSFNRLRFKYAILMAAQIYGVPLYKSLTEKMISIARVSQR